MRKVELTALAFTVLIVATTGARAQATWDKVAAALGGRAIKLADGLRAALDKMNPKKAGLR